MRHFGDGEVLTNIHPFIIVVPNHAGEDVTPPSRSGGERERQREGETERKRERERESVFGCARARVLGFWV